MRAAAAVWIVGTVVTLGCATGNGQLSTELRELGEFDSLEATQGLQVTVEQGEPASVAIRTDENLLPTVETSIRNGKLHLGIWHSQWVFPSQGVQVRVVTPRVSRVEATSASSVRLDGVSQAELSVEADSSALIELRGLQVERLTAAAESAARVILEGSADSLEASSTATATFTAGELQARVVRLDASSASGGVVRATEEITGTVDSGAAFVIRGNPARRLIEVESGGQVRYGE